jgi:hypothetical protein
MAEKKYKRTWRPASKGSEGPKKSMPRKKMDKTGARSYWDSAVKASRGSQKKAAQKSMASRTKKVMGKSAADMAKDRKRQVVAKKAGPTKRRVAGEPPNRSMSVKARSVRAGRVRDRKVGQMNDNIKKMQRRRPY